MNEYNDGVIRNTLADLHDRLVKKIFVEVRGQKTVEILNFNETFNGSEDGMCRVGEGFMTINDYVRKELQWYKSQNPKVDEISSHASMWGEVADDRNMANSNYGFLIFSPQNGYQYDNVLKLLKEDRNTRQAVMHYSNPFIHYTGGKDKICTLTVSYMIREGFLHAFVNMRSNDIRYGLIGADLSWQCYVLKLLAGDLNADPGLIFWHADSLHLYERHFDALDKLVKGE